jgi:hypothetical protein
MPAEVRRTLNERLAHLSDALFDYDKATIRPDARKALDDDVKVIRDILADYPSQKLIIEGHCDERGLGRVQHGAGRPPRRRFERVSELDGHSANPAHRDQLRKGQAGLHRKNRGVLAEEPPRSRDRSSVTDSLDHARELKPPSPCKIFSRGGGFFCVN